MNILDKMHVKAQSATTFMRNMSLTAKTRANFRVPLFLFARRIW